MIKGRMPILACGPFLCLPLLSCGGSSQPTAQERRELENVARMLDEAPNTLANIDENALRDPQPEPEEPVRPELNR